MSSSIVLEPSQVETVDVAGSADLVQEIVEAFQAAQRNGREADLSDFLLDAEHPFYSAVLHELILLDLRNRWYVEQPRPLSYYRQRFPEAFSDIEQLRELIQCDYHLRLQAGENPVFEEYTRQFGSGVLAVPDLPRTVHATFRSEQLAGEALAEREKQPTTTNEDFFPHVGEEFLGFDLLARIGQGAFAHVYLARQKQLNDRFVVLKVSQEKAAEADVLAQLLHANIVPIYSFHTAGPLHATCMPFLGTTTLADVLTELRSRGLPQSGKNFVETLRVHSTRSSSLMHGSSQERIRSPLTPTPVEVSLTADPILLEPKTRIILDNLETLSYPEAVLWMAGQLADGLAHAHERGILHRDLKPANILLTNEGQPMLLDFNLAEDIKLRTNTQAARLGGTLLYMSPEQLGAFGGLKRPLDGRSDIYSFGIILYEFLTGRFPFAVHDGSLRKILPKMIEERQDGPPLFPPECKNASPAMQAIIRKCLEPDPDRRYQSARELEEDIQRQMEHQSLKHAPEPSLKERFDKWRRRHPRLASLTTVLCLATILVLGLATLVYARGERLKQYEALETFHRFEEHWTDVQFLLTSPITERDELQQLLEKGRQSLQSYSVLASADWRTQPAVQYLSREQQDNLEKDVASVLLLLAQARAMEARQMSTDRRQSALQEAMVLNEKAELAGAAAHLPHTFWTQRANFLALLGDTTRALELRRQTNKEVPKNGQDIYLLARDHLLHGRTRKALDLLQEVTSKEPKNVPAWFLKGRCHEELGEPKDAVVCYTTCIAFRPQTAQAYFRRGLVYLRDKDHDHAWTDFNKVVELQPRNADAFFNRALAWKGLGQTQKAIEDLGHAIENDLPWTRVWFLRANWRRELGDIPGALQDHKEGMKRTPIDLESWISRGVARLADDPKGALADFQKALSMDPRSFAAMNNIAHVRAQVQQNAKDALSMLDQLVRTYPNHVGGRSARGLLLAQLGRRDDALKDAQVCLRHRLDPAMLFRIAAIYAQTSRIDADDTESALRLLRRALQKGYGFNLIDRDPTFAPLRKVPEFRRLVSAVREVRKK